MQFSCESCKAQLQIADEKVRGKRLIVRCRRCGAKIALADPALANSAPRLVERSSAPGPMRISPRPAGAERQRTDEDSTRAMDSDVLERALQASKADDVPQNGSPGTQKLHFPRPTVPPEDIDWFAMIRGKQVGPVSRDELLARANDGEIGPRTYLWREGMDAWQRAVDVPELWEMFPQLPAANRPPPAPAAAAAAPQAAPPQLNPGTASGPVVGAAPADPAAPHKNALDLARWATSELSQEQELPQADPAPAAPSVQHKLSPPLVQGSAPMFESAAPMERGPFMVFLGLMALAAAAIVLWIVLAAAPAKKDEPASGLQAQVAPQPQAGQPEPKPPDPQPADPPPESKAQPPPAAATGLTADQVHRKLDENKPALQGCVDEALRRDPHLRVGKIHVATTIAPSGQVTAARIDQRTVDESPLGACLKRATRTIVFPPFAGAAFDVDIPIVVTAGE